MFILILITLNKCGSMEKFARCDNHSLIIIINVWKS